MDGHLDSLYGVKLHLLAVVAITIQKYTLSALELGRIVYFLGNTYRMVSMLALDSEHIVAEWKISYRWRNSKKRKRLTERS